MALRNPVEFVAGKDAQRQVYKRRYPKHVSQDTATVVRGMCRKSFKNKVRKSSSALPETGMFITRVIKLWRNEKLVRDKKMLPKMQRGRKLIFELMSHRIVIYSSLRTHYMISIHLTRK